MNRTRTPYVTLLAGSYEERGHVDGNGAEARFGRVGGPHELGQIAIDSVGNLFVADTDNHTIRKITPEHEVSTILGSPARRGILDGPQATAQLEKPQAIAVGSDNTIYFSNDSATVLIRKLSPDGQVSTLAGSAPDFDEDEIRRDGRGAAACFIHVDLMWMERGEDGAERILMWDEDVLRSMNLDGTVSTICQAGNPLCEAFLPAGAVVDREGNKYCSGAFGDMPLDTPSVEKHPAGGDAEVFIGLARTDSYLRLRSPLLLEGFSNIVKFKNRDGALAIDLARNILYVTDSTTIRAIDLTGRPGNLLPPPPLPPLPLPLLPPPVAPAIPQWHNLPVPAMRAFPRISFNDPSFGIQLPETAMDISDPTETIPLTDPEYAFWILDRTAYALSADALVAYQLPGNYTRYSMNHQPLVCVRLPTGMICLREEEASLFNIGEIYRLSPSGHTSRNSAHSPIYNVQSIGPVPTRRVEANENRLGLFERPSPVFSNSNLLNLTRGLQQKPEGGQRTNLRKTRRSNRKSSRSRSRSKTS